MPGNATPRQACSELPLQSFLPDPRSDPLNTVKGPHEELLPAVTERRAPAGPKKFLGRTGGFRFVVSFSGSLGLRCT